MWAGTATGPWTWRAHTHTHGPAMHGSDRQVCATECTSASGYRHMDLPGRFWVAVRAWQRPWGSFVADWGAGGRSQAEQPGPIAHAPVCMPGWQGQGWSRNAFKPFLVIDLQVGRGGVWLHTSEREGGGGGQAGGGGLHAWKTVKSVAGIHPCTLPPQLAMRSQVPAVAFPHVAPCPWPRTAGVGLHAAMAPCLASCRVAPQRSAGGPCPPRSMQAPYRRPDPCSCPSYAADGLPYQ